MIMKNNMAIVIIKKEPDPKIFKEVICKNCGVTLQYLPMDEISAFHYDYDGGSDEYKYIVCPNCQKIVEL